MVVSLRDSDDSDSDVDNCSSAQMAFGGLEFMIKEARRTAEVGRLTVESADRRSFTWQVQQKLEVSAGSSATYLILELLLLFDCPPEVILWYFSGGQT